MQRPIKSIKPIKPSPSLTKAVKGLGGMSLPPREAAHASRPLDITRAWDLLPLSHARRYACAEE